MTKVISLSNRAYEILAKQKRNNESFSDVVTRITKKAEKRPLTSFAGKWSDDDIDQVFEEILSDREKSQSRKVTL